MCDNINLTPPTPHPLSPTLPQTLYLRHMPCTLQGENGTVVNQTLIVTTSMYLKDPMHVYQPACVDVCTEVDCNPSC